MHSHLLFKFVLYSKTSVCISGMVFNLGCEPKMCAVLTFRSLLATNFFTYINMMAPLNLL